MSKNSFGLFNENYAKVVCESIDITNDYSVGDIISNYESDYILKRKYGKEIRNFIFENSLKIVEKIKFSYNRDLFCREIYDNLKDIAQQIELGEKEKALVDYLVLTYKLSID